MRHSQTELVQTYRRDSALLLSHKRVCMRVREDVEAEMQPMAVAVFAILTMSATAFAASYSTLDAFGVLFADKIKVLHPELSKSLLACQDYREDGQHCFVQVFSEKTSDVRVEIASSTADSDLSSVDVFADYNGKVVSQNFISAYWTVMAIMTPQQSSADRKRRMDKIVRKIMHKDALHDVVGNVSYTLRIEDRHRIHLQAKINS